METYYVPDLAQGADALPEEEARHCLQVLRHRDGDRLRLVDGRGTVALAELAGADRKRAPFRVLEREHAPPDPRTRLHLAIAPPKNASRFEWLLEKATEIGVSRITPLVTRRSERRKGNLERWRRVLVAAMKQSERAWLPELAEPTPLAGVLADAPEHGRFIAHCGEGPRELLWRRLMPDLDTVLLIGPEGDFDPAEIAEALEANFLPVSLGHARLRTETAGLVALEWMNLCQDRAFARPGEG